MQESLFISHGAPDVAIADTAASRFLREFGSHLETPSAFVVVSAHFESRRVLVSGDEQPETIYDFGGFDERLRSITYRAPGDPELARRIVDGLTESGFDAATAEGRGFDHGTWVPLKLMRERADVPVVQVSVNPSRDARWHFSLGGALAKILPESALVLGSGSFTHNLRAVFGSLDARQAPTPEWVTAFENWMTEHLTDGDVEAVLDYRDQAPFARENHPTEEHLAPLFVALGASPDRRARLLHESHEFGALAMSAFAFE